MKTITFTDQGGTTWNLALELHRYQNGRPAIEAVDMEDGIPYARATTNLIDAPCGPGESYFDRNNAADLVDALIAAGIIDAVPSGFAPSGWCSYPRHKILVPELGGVA